MITSHLTRRGRTTIPRSVRQALGLQDGDTLAYELAGDRAVLRRGASDSSAGPFDCFEEWGGDADRVAYAGLSRLPPVGAEQE